MSTVTTIFSYDVTDINNSVRRTNVFLRAANALRLSYRDINQVMKNPSFTNIMWTLIQISRTYNALRRLQKLMVIETNKAAALFNFVIPDPTIVKTPESSVFSIAPMSMRAVSYTHLTLPTILLV